MVLEYLKQLITDKLEAGGKIIFSSLYTKRKQANLIIFKFLELRKYQGTKFISQKYRCRINIIISKRKAMGLFFHQDEHVYNLRGTCHWTDEGRVRTECSVKGFFLQRDPTGFVNSIELNMNDEKIYYYQGEILKSLELNLTVLEDHFYYIGHQSKNIENAGVYEIKLKRKNLLTIIYTENFETFITFYKHLAKYTILTCFEKHFKLMKLIGRGSTSKVYIGQNLISK